MKDKQQEALPLSFLDQQPHIRVYGRYYIIFSFPDLSHAEAAAKALHTGFKEVLRRFPYLAGTVCTTDTTHKGLEVLFPCPLDLEAEASRVFTVSLDNATNASYDYDEMQKTHFLPELFPAKDFCPALIKHHPSLEEGDHFAQGFTHREKDSLPTFAAQATFIPGGLVLSVWFHHPVIDGSGNARIQEVWSAAVRGLTECNQDGGRNGDSYISKADDSTSDASLARAALASLAREPTPRDLATCSTQGDLTRENIKEKVGPLRKTPYKVITKLFRFRKSAISQLSSTVSGLNKKYTSHFAALAGLIWASVIQARLPSLIASGNTKSTLAVVIDLRKHVQAPFSSPDYLGNLVLSETPTWSFDEQLGDQVDNDVGFLAKASPGYQRNGRIPTASAPRLSMDTSDLAIFVSKISDSVAKVNHEWVATQFHRVITEPGSTQQALLVYPNGPDLYITSWQHMGVDREWCIPGAGDTQPTAIRRAAWTFEGGIVVLPRKKDRADREPEPYEAMVSLAEDDMKALERGLRDGHWLMDTTA